MRERLDVNSHRTLFHARSDIASRKSPVRINNMTHCPTGRRIDNGSLASFLFQTYIGQEL